MVLMRLEGSGRSTKKRLEGSGGRSSGAAGRQQCKHDWRCRRDWQVFIWVGKGVLVQRNQQGARAIINTGESISIWVHGIKKKSVASYHTKTVNLIS